MYHVSAQGIDERMINVHYYYYYIDIRASLAKIMKSIIIICQTELDVVRKHQTDQSALKHALLKSVSLPAKC